MSPSVSPTTSGPEPATTHPAAPRRRGPAGRIRPRRTALLAAAVTGAAVLLAGCGSSYNGGGNAGTTPTAPSSAAPGGGASGTPAACAATPTAMVSVQPTFNNDQKQIATNWERFFSKDTPLAERACLIEGGSRVEPLIQQFGQNPLTSQVTAQVTNVVIDPNNPNSATVTYNIVAGGATLVPNSSGKAVKEDGTWKVGLASLCGLLALQGNPGPLCNGSS